MTTTTQQRDAAALIRDHHDHATVVINYQFTPGQRERFSSLLEEYPTIAEAMIDDWSPATTKLRLYLNEAVVMFLFDTAELFEVPSE